MRTLAAQLTTAQQQASTQPQVDISIENTVGSSRRHDFTVLDTTAFTVARHGVAVASDNSVTRVRNDGSGNILKQRNATPTTGAGYAAAYTSLASGKGNLIAVAARGARVAIVYVDAAGTGVKIIESVDSGATFSGEVAVKTSAATVIDLAVAYKSSAGDLAVSWLRGTTIDAVRRASGTYGSVISKALGAASLTFIAMCFGFDFDILITGIEVTTNKPTLWSIVFGDGSDAPTDTWGTLTPQVQAESDSSVAFSYPFVVSTDAYRYTYVESDTFTGGNTRAYRSQLHGATSFASGPFTTAEPQPVNYTDSHGIAIAADAGGAGAHYESSASRVARAPQSQVLRVVTSDVLAVTHEELPYTTRTIIDLDNSTAQYAAANNAGVIGDPPAPIQVGNIVHLAFGYYTSVGPLSSPAPDIWIDSYKYIRDGSRSILRLTCSGAWDRLARTRSRTAITHTTDPYTTIIQRLCLRSGVMLFQASASSRSQTVQPKTILHPYTTSREHIRTLLAYLGDRLRCGTISSAKITEFLASDAVSYTFGAAHSVYHAELATDGPTLSQARAFGALAFGEAIDYPNAQVPGLTTYENIRDQNSTTGATAAATATAHLRQRQLDGDAGQITVPPNCGEELYDIISITDPLVSTAPFIARVGGITWKYERRTSVYRQTLKLGPR